MATRLLAPADREKLLTRRLPARMRELHAFIELAEPLRLHAEPTPKPVKVIAGTTAFSLSTPLFLLHPLADAGVVIGRALLNFLGIGLKTNLAKLDVANDYKSDDIHMEHLGLSLLSPEQASRNWNTHDEAQARELFELCIRTGNKVSAHLTKRTAVRIGADIPKLVDAFKLVNALVNREVYQTLREPPISFLSGSSYGHVDRTTNLSAS